MFFCNAIYILFYFIFLTQIGDRRQFIFLPGYLSCGVWLFFSLIMPNTWKCINVISWLFNWLTCFDFACLQILQVAAKKLNQNPNCQEFVWIMLVFKYSKDNKLFRGHIYTRAVFFLFIHSGVYAGCLFFFFKQRKRARTNSHVAPVSRERITSSVPVVWLNVLSLQTNNPFIFQNVSKPSRDESRLF